MFLSYSKYIDLITALDEYSKFELSKEDLQRAIFDHYTRKHGSIIVENHKGSRLRFAIKYQKPKYNKSLRKQFINFMNK